jgi:tetratricopeptide (TPR) repeat protein
MHPMIPLLIALSVLLACAAKLPGPLRDLPDDQIPAYGGMDRDTPEIRKADDAFIAQAMAEHGSREAASRAYSEAGFRFYEVDDLENAMRSFNQAWLLDEKNPAAFHGFGAVLNDRAVLCLADSLLMRARELGLETSVVLADIGRTSSLCGVIHQREGRAEMMQERFANADAAFATAFELAGTDVTKRGYVYATRATALYWRGSYEEAWVMVVAAEEDGWPLPSGFMDLLTAQRPRPSSTLGP